MAAGMLMDAMAHVLPTPVRAILLALGLGPLAACAVHRKAADPVVLVETRAGPELGVSTDWGIVFLGQTARFGRADVVVWFGDGPSIEPTVVEPIGSGLFVLETEIRTPSVPITFEEPKPGARVELRGRTAAGSWKLKAKVTSHPAVEGILLEMPPELSGPNDQVGAGVFVTGHKDQEHLLGLVSGRLILDSQGERKQFLTVVGPRDLWRLVAYRRDDALKRRWVWRDDVL